MSNRLHRHALRTWWAPTLLLVATIARADLDPPASGALFGFPGSFATPASVASAGHALADRWLGDSPFDNPAVGGPDLWGQGALLYLREDRQDLRAANREFDGGAGALDYGGVAIGGRLLRGLTGALYSYRPDSRSEDVAFFLGRGTDPTQPSALVTGKTETRETRSGVALSRAFGPLRVGLAVELVNRSDHWTRTLESGAPESGTRETSWKGSGTGGQIGFRWASLDSGGLVVGGGLRFVPQLELSGSSTANLLTGSSDSSVTTTRASGWEAGVSASHRLGPMLQVIAGVGMRTAMDWSGLDATSGRVTSEALAFDYHDATAPWTMRFGYAFDQQSDVPESRAGSLGLSFGWDFGGTIVELGGMHRGIHRSGAPTSYEDRVLLGFRAPF